jgi:hypothetical protein
MRTHWSGRIESTGLFSVYKRSDFPKDYVGQGLSIPQTTNPADSPARDHGQEPEVLMDIKGYRKLVEHRRSNGQKEDGTEHHEMDDQIAQDCA